MLFCCSSISAASSRRVLDLLLDVPAQVADQAPHSQPHSGHQQHPDRQTPQQFPRDPRAQFSEARLR